MSWPVQTAPDGGPPGAQNMRVILEIRAGRRAFGRWGAGGCEAPTRQEPPPPVALSQSWIRP
jgi:hypothetical protein